MDDALFQSFWHSGEPSYVYPAEVENVIVLGKVTIKRLIDNS
jgi:hypothetical protein